MLSRVPEQIMLFVGFALSALVIWMADVPREFNDIKTYTFYTFALAPGLIWYFASRPFGRRTWCRVLLRIVWIAFLVLIGISLEMWRTDGWAGVIWYCLTGTWLVFSIILALVAFILAVTAQKFLMK